MTNTEQDIVIEKEKKKRGVLGWFLAFFSLKFLFLFVASTSFFMIVMNFISVLPGTFLPKNTSSTIAFYKADSFYGLPINFNRDSKTIPELALPIMKEELDNIEESINKGMQARLDEKFGANRYIAKVFRKDTYTHSDGTEYQNINNISTLSENIVTFGLEITDTSKNLTERIYFYSVDTQGEWFFSKYDSYYKAKEEKDNILFVKNINGVGTYSENFNEFVKLIQSGKGGDGRDKYAKEAFQYLLGKEGEEWNEYIKTDLEFRPYFSDIFQNDKKGALEKFGKDCYGSYTTNEPNQLDCSKGQVKIRIGDDSGMMYPKEMFRNHSVVIKNVTTTGPEMTRNYLKEYANILTKYNQLKFHDSYFVDMLNFVGTEHGNSNQKVLSKERINLEYFQKKNLGKTNKEMVMNSGDIVKFNPGDAKSILDMPGDNDAQDSVFEVKQVKKNTENEVYKKGDGFASDKIVSKCTGLPIVYPDMDSVINGFSFSETYGSGATACSHSFEAPPLLEEGEIKYYKRFNFIDNIKENEKKGKGQMLLDTLFGKKENKDGANVITRKKEDYKLNFFYHYTEPKNITLKDKKNSLLEGNYISDIGLDNSTVLWNGIYLRVKSYGIVINDEDGTFDIKRDSRDGTPLFADMPVKFEIGLLTSLDDKIVESTRDKKGEIKTSFKTNEVVANFDKVNKVFAKHEEAITGGSIWSSITAIFTNPFHRYLANNYEERNGVPYNTFLSRYNMVGAIDKPEFSEWRDNKVLKTWGAPFLIKKWNENYLNTYFNEHMLQRRFMKLLDDVYHGAKNTEGKYDFALDKMMAKYAVLFGGIDGEIAKPMPGSKEKVDTISNYMCRKYAKATRTAEKISEEMKDESDLPYEAIQSRVLLEQSTIYIDCFKGYFDNIQIDWGNLDEEKDEETDEEKKDREEKKKIMNLVDDENSLHKIIPTLYNIDLKQNDLYFLYRSLKDNEVDVVYTDKDGAKRKLNLSSYIRLVEYLIGTDGNPDTNEFYIDRLKAIVKGLQEKGLLDGGFSIEKEQKEFLKKLEGPQKNFYLYEYRNFSPVLENYKKDENLISRLELNRNNSYFFDIKSAFSYEEKHFNKEDNLHELYVNPNIYLYSYFKGIKLENKVQTVNVKNEDNLWSHKVSDFDKLAYDSSMLFNYADNINNHILFLPQLQSYSVLAKDYYTDKSGGISTKARYEDAKVLSWFNKSILNDMVKYGLVFNYYQNLPLYNQLGSLEKSPITDGNSLNINIASIKKKHESVLSHSNVSLDKVLTMSQHILYLLPGLDLILKENAQKSLKDRVESLGRDGLIETEVADGTEKFTLALWSFLSGYDPEKTELYAKRSNLKKAMEFVISDRLLKGLSMEEKNKILPIIASASKGAFGFGFDEKIALLNPDELVLGDFTPSYKENQMNGLYEDEEKKKKLEALIGQNGSLNEFIQENIGAPYNKNRAYSTVIYEEKFIDPEKIKEYFAPVLNFDPANDPHKEKKSEDTPLNDETNGIAANVENLSGATPTDNNQSNTSTETTASGSVDNSTGSGSTEENASTYTSVNSTGLSVGSGSLTGFKKDNGGMFLRDYKNYTKGGVDTLSTKGRYRTDFNLTIDAIAKLEYFSGNSEVEITENLVGLTGRPDEEGPQEVSETSSGSTADTQPIGNNSVDIKTYKDISRQLRALERNKQCLVYLESVDKNLYNALYTFNLPTETGKGSFNMMSYRKPTTMDLYGLSYNDKMKIFTFMTENKQFLNCNNLSKDEYKIYLDYVQAKIKLELETYIKNDENLVKSYKVYNNISRLSLPSTYSLFEGDGLEKANKETIRSTPSYKMQEAMFLNKGNFEGNPKAVYKFISTTRGAGNNLLISDKIEKADYRMFNVQSNMILNTILANQATLYEGLQELSRELYNYSEKDNIKKIQTFTNISNLGPFYYLYTNNGYIKPEEGINFELLDISALNNGAFGGMGDPSLLLMDPSLFSAYGEKAGINAYLDKISSGFCEQKNGNDRIKCKNYMEFLKGMNMPTYMQEIEYLSYLKGAELILGKYPIVGGSTGKGQTPSGILSHRVILGQDSFRKNISGRFPKYYDKYLKTFFEEGRNTSYVGQCTWFTQLYKNYKTSGDGRKVVEYMRSTKGVTVDSFNPKNPEHAMKVIRPGDIISFYGFNIGGSCYHSAASGHVAMVVKTDPSKQTITVAEGNVSNWFKTSVATYNVKGICPGQVAHGVKARYAKSEVIFNKGEDAVADIISKDNSGSGSTAETNSGATASGSAN